MQNSKIPFWEILKTLVLFAIAFGVILLIAKKIDLITNKDESNIPLLINKIIKCPLDSKNFEDIKKITLIEGHSSYASKNDFVGDINVQLKRSGGKSKIACGYLFYRVSNGLKPIDQKYMGLYMGSVDGVGGVQFGGHILPNDNNSIIKEVNNKTEVLMPLNTIFYDGTDRVNIKQVDWVSLLNVSNIINFNIALNTTTPKGKIDLVQFGYKCINSETGEESQDCNLEIINK